MDSLTHILSSKLRPPAHGEDLAHRPRLLRTLDSTTGKVTLVVAPAGFGKTTLLSDWIQSAGESGAWISLGSENDDVTSFLNHVLAALAQVNPEIDHLRKALAGEDDVHNTAHVAKALLIEVERPRIPWTLVLDDYHVITNPVIHVFVANLINSMADGCRLVISSRIEPPLPIARLRVQGELALITVEDLRATAAECRVASRALGMEISSLQAQAIAERTAGWMTALHLIALAGRSQPIDQLIQRLDSFYGELDLLRDFLLQEVLGQEVPEMQEFLLQISILDRFTVETCYAVTDNAASGQFLEHARRNGLFLSELDDSRTWFRFHPLFREFLRHELNLRTHPDSTLRLHLAASRWFKQHNLDDEALLHAVAAEDWTSAKTMIKTIAYHLLFSHRVSEIVPWLESFPKDVILEDPDLSSIAAYFLVRQGRIAESSPYLEAAELLWQGAGNDMGVAIVEVIRGEIARLREDGVKLCVHGLKSISLATRQFELTDPFENSAIQPQFLRYTGTWMEPFPNMISYKQLALGLICQGKIADGSRIAEEVLSARLTEGDHTGLRTGIAIVGHARLASGRLVEAEAILRSMVTPELDDMPAELVLGIAALSEVMYEWNHVSESERLLDHGIRILARGGAESQDSPLRLQLARARWSQGDLDGAFAALDAAAASATILQDRHRLNQVEAFRARIALSVADVNRARTWALARRMFPGISDTGESLQEPLVLARLQIANGDTEDAVELLENLRRTAEQNGARHDLIQILTLLSVTYLDLFELDQAVDILQDALEIGEPGGYVRVFVDEGPPMSRLLRIAHRRGLRVHYINMLLAASGEPPEDLSKFTHADLVEPITARELDVLRLVALSLTNKEISDELYIAVSTVKRHITNLYGKLGVSSRTEAVQKARKLNLLSANHDSIGVFAEASPEQIPSQRFDVYPQLRPHG